jgi:hypothetical protein
VFEAIFLSILISGWLVAASLPWFALSIATRGRAGLGMLPLCWVAGLTAAFAVPLLGATDASGLKLSFAVAFVVPVVLLAIRRFSATAPVPAPREQVPHGEGESR